MTYRINCNNEMGVWRERLSRHTPITMQLILYQYRSIRRCVRIQGSFEVS